MKFVYQHENNALVHSAKNLLELNGIDCFLKDELSVSMAANHSAELGISNDNYYAKATSIIENEIFAGTNKDSWICGNCAEENDGNFESCWKCRSEAVPL